MRVTFTETKGNDLTEMMKTSETDSPPKCIDMACCRVSKTMKRLCFVVFISI